MLRNNVRIFLRVAAGYGIGLNSLRTIGIVALFLAGFALVHFFLRASNPNATHFSFQRREGGGLGVPQKEVPKPGGAQAALADSVQPAQTPRPAAQAPSLPGGVQKRSKKNPFILQLSQGRSGSTLTGTMMLEKHPACGLYIDELVMVMYRTKLAEENGTQALSAELLLNASQCDFSNRVLWDQAEINRWMTKRDRFANPENEKPKDWFDIPHLERLCTDTSAHVPRQAVCSKEIRFLEHTDELLAAAARMEIPLYLLYLMRDPRGSAMSQLWNYPKMRFAKNKDLRVMGRDLIQEHCRIALTDLRALERAAAGIQTMHICFEDFLADPKAALEHVYSRVDIFRDYPLGGAGDDGLIPATVTEFGREHCAKWGNETMTPKPTPPEMKKELAYGEVDHPFSTDRSRASRVDSWKAMYLAGRKYDTMRSEWRTNADCIALRKISKCSHRWEKLDNDE